MSWLNLNQSLNSLKGQITNFASEVLSEDILGSEGAAGSGAQQTDQEVSHTQLQELTDRCRRQDDEIFMLRKLNEELQSSLDTCRNDQRLSLRNGAVNKDEEPWFWDPPSPKTQKAEETSEATIGQVLELQTEIANLKLQLETTGADKHNTKQTLSEVDRLKEENANLSRNLDDLDQQHQQSMEKLLTLKKELQKNFEFLKRDYEELKSTKDNYANEIENMKQLVLEKDEIIKNIQETSKTDYETLHHKYVNLEKVHSILQETTEKFQEENQDLHEEVFKLQEELAKCDHDHESHLKRQTVTDMIPREKYEELLRDYMQIQERKSDAAAMLLDDTNIDDNAKSVIKNLKQDISDLQRKLAHAGEAELSNHSVRDVDSAKLVDAYNTHINFNLPGEHSDESANHCNLTQKIEGAIKSLSSYKKEIDTLNGQLTEKTIVEKSLRTQLHDATSENEFLTADLTQCERELFEMKKNNDFLLSEITALKNSSKLQPIIESHEDNIVKLESELADCNKINKNFENEIKTIKKSLCEVNDEKVSLQKDLTDLHTKYDQMLIEFENHKSKPSINQEYSQFTNNEYVAKLKNASEEIEELKSKLNLALGKNEQLSIEHSIAQNEALLFEHQVSELKQSLEEKDKKGTKITTLERKLDELESNVNEVTKLKKEIELSYHKIIEKVKIFAESIKDKENLEKYSETFKNSNMDIDAYLYQIVLILLDFRNADCDLKSQINKHENILTDIELLKLQNQNVTTENSQIDTKLKAAEEKLSECNVEIEELKNRLKEKEDQLNNLQSNCVLSSIKENDALEEQMEALNNNLQTYISSDEALLTEIENLKLNLSTANAQIDHYRDELARLASKYAEKENELLKLQTEKQNLVKLKESFESDLAKSSQHERESEKLSIELKQKKCEIDHLNLTLLSNQKDISGLNETINNLKSIIKAKDDKINELQANEALRLTSVDHPSNESYEAILREREAINIENLELENKIQLKELELNEVKGELESMQKTVEEQIAALEAMKTEKVELINFITVKHNENVQYHNEIQRLNQVILKHTEDCKHLLEEKEKLKKDVENCSECVKLKVILKDKDEQLRVERNSNPSHKIKRELTSANETIKNLTDKCEELDKNLTIQLDVVKTLMTEKTQLSEREQTLSRELERLRQHLVESEETHTQELVAAEQRVQDYKLQLTNIEERAKHNGTVYTSNNIRAQQELDTLRSQLRLQERQREETSARLADTEDELQRARAALANLQIVIEQFQNEKERDIESAISRLRCREQDMRSANESLRTEIANLSSRLEESMAGLQAASRLGDQLELKNAQLQELKEKVSALEAASSAAERRRLAEGAGAAAERVDRGLVKNLVLNYLQAVEKRTADGLQVLRVLSSVLDFTQQECERLGLARGSAGTGAASAAGPHDSLAREFVRFLEKESRPAVLPSMAGLSQAVPRPRRDSALATPPPSDATRAPDGHRRAPSGSSNNALLQHVATEHAADERPSLVLQPGVNQTRNTEGAILKHALRDV